ncbi:MAG: hypothetical protein FWF49_05700, partial [Oscillospiraceae bacterium]|nr:hypothetical protein [Oscillospiraceae bacterium]
MKKILCMLAAVAIAIPLLSACTTTGGPVATGADGRYVKPVTFTTVRPAYAGMQVPSGWDLTNNPFSDYMKKELNASFTVTWEDNDYETHLIMDMTSNTLADVFYVETYNTFMQLYQGNALADLKPALDAYENEGRYASSYVKDCYGSYDQDYIFGPVTRNGELLALPSVTGGYQQELL